MSKQKTFALEIEELQEAIEDAYQVALSSAAAEAFGGSYAISQLAPMVDRTVIIDQAMALILGDGK